MTLCHGPFCLTFRAKQVLMDPRGRQKNEVPIDFFALSIPSLVMTERDACHLHGFRKPTFPISKHGSLFFPCDAPSVLLQ